jgi:hypothetical protein
MVTILRSRYVCLNHVPVLRTTVGDEYPPWGWRLTTNFDRALLDAFAAAREGAPRDYRLGDASFAQAVWEKHFHISRIHGSVEDVEGIVLSEHQFERLLQTEPYIELLTRAFTDKAVLFLGFLFYDPAIRHVLEHIDKKHGAATPGRHLAIVPKGSKPQPASTSTSCLKRLAGASSVMALHPRTFVSNPASRSSQPTWTHWAITSKRPQKGSSTFSYSTRRASVGRTYLHQEKSGSFQFAGYLIRFRVDPAKALPAFVFQITQSPHWDEWIVSQSKTGIRAT